jgi:hypothetical protein
LKYGLLVSLLVVNYALKKAPKTTPNDLLSGSDQEFIEENKKNISIFSSDNQLVNTIVEK